jgi:hypothetical protein
MNGSSVKLGANPPVNPKLDLTYLKWFSRIGAVLRKTELEGGVVNIKEKVFIVVD